MNNELSISQIQSRFLSRVYGWLCLGFSITAFTTLFISRSPMLIYLCYTKGLFIKLSLFGLLFAMSILVNRISSRTTATFFLIYSVLIGASLSSIFLVYTEASIFYTFLIAAGMFAALSAYGHFTECNLSSMGTFLYMGLFGLAISSLLNVFFFKSAEFSWYYALFGIVIFALYTAYDSQNLKKLSLSFYQSNEDFLKLSIIGALNSHLNFINLFLFLLRILGKERD